MYKSFDNAYNGAIFKYKYFSIFKTLSDSGLHNEDLMIIYNKIKNKIPEELERSLVKSFIDKQNTSFKIIPYDKFIEYLEKLDKIPYRDDTYAIKTQILCKTQDSAQITIIDRIINRKPFTPSYKSLKDIKNENKLIINTIFDHDIEKKCPHCLRKCLRKRNSDYVICGYTYSGYDWKGCGKDWCFKCEKMLCKTWHIDYLYDPRNKFHNSKCCKDHAQKNKNIYPDDYCQCKIPLVNRSTK